LAITRASASSVTQGLPKQKTILAGNSTILPGSYESIATVTGTGSSGTLTFTSIVGTYKHLQIRGISRSDYAGANVQIAVRFNSDTASNYSGHYIVGIGSTVTASGAANQTFGEGGQVTGATSTASAMGVAVLDVLDYADSNKYKTLKSLSGFDANGSGQILLTSGNWRNTAAITSITLLAGAGNWTTASTFALYGIK
jgi:hypothetical protein